MRPIFTCYVVTEVTRSIDMLAGTNEEVRTMERAFPSLESAQRYVDSQCVLWDPKATVSYEIDEIPFGTD